MHTENLPPPVSADAQEDVSEQRLLAELERVRAADLFGKSEPLQRIFEYLAKRIGSARSARSPSEFEIAVDALDKDSSFDVTQDASIRVYMHRLRKKLDDFYATQTSGGRLVIPRGTYKFAIDVTTAPVFPDPENPPPPEVPAAPDESPLADRPRAWRPIVLSLVAALVLMTLSALMAAWWVRRGDYPEALAATEVWRPLTVSGTRSVIVVGDQPLPGGQPHVVSRGTVSALTIIYPGFVALSHAPPAGPSLVSGSYMSPSLLRDANVVYIGTFSQLGLLRDLVFRHSSYTLSDEDKVLIDRTSARRFVSAPPPFIPHRELTSYAYLACLVGPSGKRILIISGATDGAVEQAAAIAANPKTLSEISGRTGPAFEALYAVRTVDSVIVDSRYVLARPISSSPVPST